MVPINPIDTLEGAQSTPSSRKGQSARIKPVAARGDVIDISEEAHRIFTAELANSKMISESHQKDESSGSAWTLGNGLKSGSFTLENGNTQKVAIEGNKLVIEEFDGDKLVKSITGTIAGQSMSLDTEYYDASGKLTQSIHTEIIQGEAKGKWTAAHMTRDIKWYDGGMLKGEMQDSMLLQTRNRTLKSQEGMPSQVKSMLSRGTQAVNTDVDGLMAAITTENQHADYFARIKEYGPDTSKLAREIVLDQSLRSEQYSNRTHGKVDGMDGRTTRELGHDTGLSVHIKNYDTEGELVREARFTDQHVDRPDTSDGELKQTVDVSWYNKGELVKHSRGDMSFEETPDLSLSERPGFLELMGMDHEEYLGEEPQTALELMARKSVSNGSVADMFMKGVARHIADHDYNPAEGIAEYGENRRPYSMTWTDERYEDGELTMRSRDTESAHASSFWQRERALLFRKGGALSENDAPEVLRRSSHEREVFDNGEVASRQSLEAKEWVDVNMDGPDALRTTSTYQNGPEGEEVTTVINAAGSIEDADPNPNSAADGFSGELKLTLETLSDSLRSLKGEEGDKAIDFRVRAAFNLDQGN